MSDAIISRRGGSVLQQALAPTITEISSTTTSVTFTLTNNDAASAVILYEIGDTSPDADSIELAGGATSGNLTISNLSMPITLFATANSTGKIKSNLSELLIIGPIYTTATGGTTQEYNASGKRFRSHRFLSNGTFQVTAAGNGDRNVIDYLIIAGGASGASTNQQSWAGSGGGAGGYRTTGGGLSGGPNPTLEPKIISSVGTFPVVVGAGGTGSFFGNNGANSSAFGITSIGGGRGASATINNGSTGFEGGSGGGAASGAIFAGGSGTTGQGFNGGESNNTGTVGGGAGGGGAGGVGVTVNFEVREGVAGGIGLTNTLRDNSPTIRGRGGRGGNAVNFQNTISSGEINAGGGGSGARGSVTSGAGGSGFVVIRYEILPV